MKNKHHIKLDQSEGYPEKCRTCGHATLPHRSYCSQFCARKFGFLFFDETGKQCCTKTDDEIAALLLIKK